jgi:hypothetical protein
MQLMIESNEPVDRVLQVVGALYGVELAVVTGPEAAGAESPALPEERGKPKSLGRRGARKSASNQTRARQGTVPGSAGTGIDLAAVRSWARANGYDVSDRGRVRTPSSRRTSRA